MTHKPTVPNNVNLIEPVYEAIKLLGGSGTNREIYEKIIEILDLPEEVTEIPHLGSTTMTELYYRVAWAKTILKKEGRITNSERAVWSISLPLEAGKIKADRKLDHESGSGYVEEDTIEEFEPWREKLLEFLFEIGPYSFEKLAQRLLRECGFEQVEVTKRSRDGGIDGYGKLKVNGIFCFNVAFQCKRYRGSVPASDIRDFRGSLPKSMEKGIFITTGIFSRDAILEASDAGKQQIDLIDGEELVTKMKELSLGIREVRDYVIDRDFFKSLSL